MAYVKKNRVYAAKSAVIVSAGILCAAAVFYGAYLLNWSPMTADSADTSGGIVNSAGEKTVKIARAKVGMSKGEMVDTKKAELVEVPVELAPKGAVTSYSKLDNKRLNKEIAEKEFLNEMDLMSATVSFEDGDRLIEHNFPEGTVPEAVAEGSAIDIKLFIKGEEDPVVISKVVVISRDANLLSFYMNRREQEYLKEAAAEGMLFSVQYIDASQSASDITYTPLYEKEKNE